MNITFERSSKGARARPPRWWGVFVSNLPRVIIPALYPKEWSKELAEAWVKRIPPKCPFERQIWLGEILIVYVPALCPLNPLAVQLYEIRLKAQTYLASLPQNLV